MLPAVRELTAFEFKTSTWIGNRADITGFFCFVLFVWLGGEVGRVYVGGAGWLPRERAWESLGQVYLCTGSCG